MNKTVGIYAHIPFCLRKCYYCDFCSEAAEPSTQEAYVRALCREIEDSVPTDATVDTLFIGGGTPSILPPRQIEKILDTLYRSFSFDKNCEITIEANPATVTEEKARVYRAIGISRVSIGAQSFVDQELRALGRMHEAKDAYDAVRMFRRAGFDNINLDLMYGIPSQTLATFRQTLAAISELSPEHFSAYGLILEEGTPLYQKRDSLLFPSTDEERSMYDEVCAFARGKGYRHYEISNYAKDGFECRHNLRYWEKKDYLAFGVASYATVNSVRYAHTESLSRYLAGESAPYVTERLSEAENDAERVMLGLRTDKGVPASLLMRVAGEEKRDFLRQCEKAGYMERKGESVFLSESGMYLSNAILREILP